MNKDGQLTGAPFVGIRHAQSAALRLNPNVDPRPRRGSSSWASPPRGIMGVPLHAPCTPARSPRPSRSCPAHNRATVRAEAPSNRPQGRIYTTADLVPPDWQLQPPDPNLKGQRFVSADGTASLALFATPAKQEPIAKHMNAVAFVDGEQITHLHGEENWIEVSGSKADHSFYRKAVLACGGRAWHEVAFEYPTQTQGSISEFVSRAAKAVQNSEDQGCEDSASPIVGQTPALGVPTTPSSSSND